MSICQRIKCPDCLLPLRCTMRFWFWEGKKKKKKQWAQRSKINFYCRRTQHLWVVLYANSLTCSFSSPLKLSKWLWFSLLLLWTILANIDLLCAKDYRLQLNPRETVTLEGAELQWEVPGKPGTRDVLVEHLSLTLSPIRDANRSGKHFFLHKGGIQAVFLSHPHLKDPWAKQTRKKHCCKLRGKHIGMVCDQCQVHNELTRHMTLFSPFILLRVTYQPDWHGVDKPINSKILHLTLLVDSGFDPLHGVLRLHISYLVILLQLSAKNAALKEEDPLSVAPLCTLGGILGLGCPWKTLSSYKTDSDINHQKSHSKISERSWRDGSVIETTNCPCRRPGFGS